MINPLTADQLIENIEQLIKDFEHFLMSNTGKSKEIFKQSVDEIRTCFNYSELVYGASYQGGISEIKKKYSPLLLRIGLYLEDNILLDIKNIEKVHTAFSTIAQSYKIKRAYTELYRGKKFQKAKLGKFDEKHPIILHSRKNIAQLMKELKELKSEKNRYGFREDESELFHGLLNLPYRLQHATNYYYAALNAGSLDSYDEIKRHNPEYESPFSTKGNISKLANGGFVFFRLYVDAVNSPQTRYGDTSIILDLKLLRKCGWISLHDQLNPFPSGSPNTRHFYWAKRLLRTSEVVSIKNDTKDKMLHDGLLYRYRISEISEYQSGSKDILNSFGKKILTIEKSRSFFCRRHYM